MVAGANIRAPDETEEGATAELTRDEAHAHIVEAAYSIAQLHVEHYRSATRHQRLIERTTDFLGRPLFVISLTMLLGGWIAGNATAAFMGYMAIDPPPFAVFAGLVSLASFTIMLLILATQRRENKLAETREQLMLELALLSDRKTAKLIELLEELRQDSPLLRDRRDEQADALAKPADPERVIEVIAETHARADTDTEC